MKGIVARGAMALVVASAAALPATSLVHATNKAHAGCVIEYIPKNTGNPYFDSIIKGFKSTVGKFGYSFKTEAPSSAGGTLQIPYINTAIAQHVCAIAISANDANAVLPALKQAMSRGIKVLAVNGPLGAGGASATILPVDFTKTGGLQIQLMAKLINYTGQFAILSATTTAPDQNEWIGYMKQELKKPIYAKMQLVKIAYGNDDPATSTTQTNALLAAYPKLKGILSPTTVGISSAAKVIDDKKMGKQVAVTGLGLPSQMRSYVLDGTVKAFQLWDPANEGIIATYLFHEMIANNFPAKPGSSFKAGQFGTVTIDKTGTLPAGPFLTFTSKNINNFKF
jgi:rhamnose transport system substrate-binding protein